MDPVSVVAAAARATTEQRRVATTEGCDDGAAMGGGAGVWGRKRSWERRGRDGEHIKVSRYTLIPTGVRRCPMYSLCTNLSASMAIG
jgi:hypothetical protein